MYTYLHTRVFSFSDYPPPLVHRRGLSNEPPPLGQRPHFSLCNAPMLPMLLCNCFASHPRREQAVDGDGCTALQKRHEFDGTRSAATIPRAGAFLQIPMHIIIHPCVLNMDGRCTFHVLFSSICLHRYMQPSNPHSPAFTINLPHQLPVVLQCLAQTSFCTLPWIHVGTHTLHECHLM